MPPPVRIHSIEGNGQLLDGGAMFGNAPKALWSRWAPSDERNRIPLACRAMLIEIGDARVLCETGIGAFFEPQKAERYGVQEPERHLLIENLEKAGFPPDSIDAVVLSHLHFDHAGGLLPTYREIRDGNDGLAFAKARFFVGAEAWERARFPHARDRASFIPGLADKLEATGRLIVVDGESHPDLFPEVLSFETSDGHTPGHMHALVRGENTAAFFAGDLIPGLPWIHLPITMGYDRFPERLIEEKEKFLERAKEEQWLLFFTHDPKNAASRVQKKRNRSLCSGRSSRNPMRFVDLGGFSRRWELNSRRLGPNPSRKTCTHDVPRPLRSHARPYQTPWSPSPSELP